MLNRSGIKKETAGNETQILFDVQNRKAVSVQVAASAGSVEGSRTIVKAGTPLSGDLTARGTAFVAAAPESAAGNGDGKKAVGVLLHDVDVTEGAANGSLLIWGFVNLDRIDTGTQAKITSLVKEELSGAVWFLKD